jgi:VIT1/CCC1 family predicted Fe2+/Mn2+ transporter
MMNLGLVVFGVLGLTRLPVRELPDVDPPIVHVTTVYTGSSAGVLESQVTEPIEEALASLEGIRVLTSESRDQVSNITVEFDLSRDIDLAALERKHKEMLAARLQAMGQPMPPEPPLSLRERFMLRQAKRDGVGAVLPDMERFERDALTMYKQQKFDDPLSAQVLQEVLRDEESHQDVVPGATALGRPESWHIVQRGPMRNVIFGSNDGLVSVLALVTGVAAGTGDSRTVIIAGLAGLVGGALSMATGAYLSVKSEMELQGAEIEREREEIRTMPEEERAELEAIYRVKGLKPDEANRMAERVTRNEEQWLDVQVREELGFAPERVENPRFALVASGASFAVGGIVPVVPFLLPIAPTLATWIAVGASLATLFLFGALKTLVTGVSWFRSGLEMMLIGAVSAGITYGIGSALGVNV